MSLPTEGKLLRIFIGEADRWHGAPLYEAIVLEARKRGLAGATVLKGFMGFGAHSRIHTAKLLELSQDLPIVVEIVEDRKSTRLNSSHTVISYAVFCLKKKTKQRQHIRQLSACRRASRDMESKGGMH